MYPDITGFWTSLLYIKLLGPTIIGLFIYLFVTVTGNRVYTVILFSVYDIITSTCSLLEVIAGKANVGYVHPVINVGGCLTPSIE